MCLERLHCLCEKNFLKKCMLSACLLITKDHRRKALKFIGLPCPVEIDFEPKDLIVWLRSAKTPVCGEGLADEGFENCDRCFAHLNRVRCPRVLRSRDVKQHDVAELITKGNYCKLRHTSEVAFSFFECVDAVKDFVPQENISALPFALEWGHAHINLQQPLRKPGKNSGLASTYWVTRKTNIYNF